MSTRPSFPLQVLSQIEVARQKIFNSKDRFNLLFLPVRNLITFGLDLNATTAPHQRMSATLRIQIQDFTAALFDTEAQYYTDRTSDLEILRSWLLELSADIRTQAKKQVADDRLDFHCTKAERHKAIEDELEERIKQWIDSKKKRQSLTTPEPPIKPVGSRVTLINSTESETVEQHQGVASLAINSLGSQIKRLREEARWTIPKLAEAVEIEPRTVERHESGQIKSLHPGTKASYEKVLTAALGRKIILD